MSSYPCTICGTVPTHLHHTLPKSVWPEHRDNPDCLIPLCFVCHNDWHDGRARVYRDALPAATLTLITRSANPTWIDKWYPTRPHPHLPF